MLKKTNVKENYMKNSLLSCATTGPQRNFYRFSLRPLILSVFISVISCGHLGETLYFISLALKTFVFVKFKISIWSLVCWIVCLFSDFIPSIIVKHVVAGSLWAEIKVFFILLPASQPLNSWEQNNLQRGVGSDLKNYPNRRKYSS